MGFFSFVPTQAMLNGDFNAVASANCNGGAPRVMKGGIVNNQISTKLFNKSSLTMMSFYTLPTDPCGKSFFGIKQNFDEKSGVAKFDYQMSDKQSLFVRYYATHALVGTPFDGK